MHAMPLGASSSEIDRVAVARMLMRLFKHWQLTPKEQLEILGYSASNRWRLSRYRRGRSISNNRDALDRAANLLTIHQKLRLLFPGDRDLAYAWMKSRNRSFDHKTPLEVIEVFGFAGLLMVRSYLDRASGQ